jgi:hypothetical protein
MWHVVSSDNSGQTDFKYVFDVFVNGVQKIRVKQYPEPTNGKGYFDAGPTVRNSMTYEWFEPINSSSYVAEPDMSGQIGISYALRVGEDYSGVTTLNLASGEVSGYNWAPPMFKRRVITMQDKLNKWLTNRPMTAEIKLVDSNEVPANQSENLFIGFYTDQPTVKLKVDLFDFNNYNSNTHIQSVATNVSTGFIQMNIGQSAIYHTLNIVIDESIKYYDVSIDGYEIIRVYTKCNPKYTCIPVHFLNRWGMFDTMRFDLASRLSMDIERKGFGQRDYKFNSNSVDYMSSSNRYYEGKINYSNAAKWSYKLNADAMNDAEYEWAAELMVSPQILLEIDGYLYPATIKKTSFDYPKIVNDKLKAFEVEFELNSNRYTQLR